MGSGSRALLLAAACVSVVAAQAAHATPAGTALRVGCPQTSFFVAFYPKGEPGRRTAHVKVYTRRELLGEVFPKRLSFGRSCKASQDKGRVWDGSRAKTTGKALILGCTVRKTVELTGIPYTDSSGRYAGNNLFATLGRTSKVFLRAKIAVSGSTLRYDPHYCKKR